MANMQPVTAVRLILVCILGGLLGGSVLYQFKDGIILQPVSFYSRQRCQQIQQPDRVRNSCWNCLQPNWRRHFIFANSSSGHLDVCPDSSGWPAGAWTHPVSSANSVHAYQGSAYVAQPLSYANPAALGEPAVLPGTLMAQKGIEANQIPTDCKQAKLAVYQAVHRCDIHPLSLLITTSCHCLVEIRLPASIAAHIKCVQVGTHWSRVLAASCFVC